ncbi:MAG: hypothetical protein QOI35_3746 [Cryptosporangiaceae bacterium]|jgi:hypothetical protein|nr:hypothetical protein [Cryptosporangiaceae bacterium]
MSDGNDGGTAASQSGTARPAGAVGKAVVGRAAVDGAEKPSPASTSPASGGGAPVPASGSTTPPAQARKNAPQLPSGSSGKGSESKDTAPSMSGSLRPSVVQAPGGSKNAGDPAKTSALPAAPSIKTGDTPQLSRPGVSARPGSGAGTASVPAAKASAPVSGSARPVGAPAAATTTFGSAGGASAPPAAGAAGVAGAARAQVGEAVRNVRATVAAAASRGPRRARLQLKKIDPWSVMKFSFAVSLVLFIVAIVATALLYGVLDALGVFKSLNATIGQLTATQDQTATATAAQNSSTQGFAITAKLVIGSAAVLGAVNMVLFTALATLGAFIYNVCADLVGGIEVTLAERD